MNKQDIITLVNCGILSMTAHDLKPAQAYKAFKLKKEVEKVFKAILWFIRFNSIHICSVIYFSHIQIDLQIKYNNKSRKIPTFYKKIYFFFSIFAFPSATHIYLPITQQLDQYNFSTEIDILHLKQQLLVV